jgi:hypothetical protein
MTRKQLLKLQLRSLKFSIIDRLTDLRDITIPIFVTSGLIVACFKFWLAVMP